MNFSYMCMRVLTFPLGFLPLSWIQTLGKGLGSLSYHLYPKFRKRTLSNLALALPLSEKSLKTLAKKSMQNLMITTLEYAKLSRARDIHSLAYCKNPEQAAAIIEKGQGVIFFCGHQANWEVLFIEGTKRMPGVAIGRPIKNTRLYQWILKIREKNGGKIIAPQNAIREGLKALKKGSFLGIVGDQGMPDSGFSSPFFGKNAWTSPMPALLSYRTGCPIIVATTRREKDRYCITYSEPLFPNKDAPQDQEVSRLMQESLLLLESSIRAKPEEWMWQHNRWKQQTLNRIKKPYRQESILIILPQDGPSLDACKHHLAVFREVYPLEFITLMIPASHAHETLLSSADTIVCHTPRDLLIKDYRFKLVFNLTSNKHYGRHFLKLGATQVVHLPHFNPEQLKTLVYAS